jgi:hypothetical protein
MLSRSKPLMFVVIPMAAVILVGGTLLEAQKPQPWQWSVELPGMGTEWNLFACSVPEECVDGVVFTDTDPFYVRVVKHKRAQYSFRLWVDNNPVHSEKIGFKGFFLQPNLDPKFEATGNGACNFPPNPPDPCLPAGADPQCVQDFLQENLHPYADSDPANDYMGVWLSIDVDCDIEGMVENEPYYPSGEIRVQVHRSDDVLADGCDDFHTVIVGPDVESGDITITRDSQDSWTIDVIDESIRFTEAYPGIREMVKGKKEHPNNVTRKPIRAISPFKFTTTWTRSEW